MEGRLRTRFIAAFSALLCLALPASAQTGGNPELQRSAEFRACIDKSDGATADMLNCLAAEHRRAERDLDLTYKDLRTQLKSRAVRNRLAETQRIWLWHRDDDCRRRVMDSGLGGGSGGALIYSDCMVSLIITRTAWLKKVSADPSLLDLPRPVSASQRQL